MSADHDRAGSERIDAPERPTGTAGPDDATRRAVRYGTIQTAVVAFLAGAFGATTLFDPLDLGHEFMTPRLSGYGAQLAQSVVALFAATVLSLFVLMPCAVACFRLLHGDEPLRSVVGWWLVAVTVPAVVLGQLWGLRLDWRAGAVTVALFAALLGTCWYLTATDRESPGAAMLANHGFVVLVAAAALAGPVAGLPLGLFVERYDSGSPSASFAYETAPAGDGTRVTVVHAGGDRVRADRLTLRVVNDSDPRPEPRVREWNGSTTYVEGRGPRRTGRYVVRGNATTITVPDDCVVRVVWERDGDTATLGKHRCEAGGGGWTPTPFPNPTVPGESG